MIKSPLEFICRFSLPPNSLGYCGRGTAPERFKACVIKGLNDGVEEELTKFIVLNPYLDTLSKIFKSPKFSIEVAEAYWLGNENLRKAQISDYKVLLNNFAKQGVPEWLVQELRGKVPQVFIPTHLFQVLHVGVGRASGSVPYNLETINNCMVRWGKVVSVDKNELKAELNSLDKTKDRYKLIRIEEKAQYLPGFLQGVKTGDTVAVHWKQAVKILTKKEERQLVFWTKEVLKSFTFL